jgi:hypothetical protein
MQRSRQQAVMFLLGAALVGGVLGFSADRMIAAEESKHWVGRSRMYNDLALTAQQQATMDSLLDERNCQISAAIKPVKPQIDSIKVRARQQINAILTTEQRARMELRIAENARKDSVQRARRDSARAANKTSVACVN